MRSRFWESNRSSYMVLEAVVPMMKMIGLLTIIGGVIAAFGIATDETLTFVDSDSRVYAAVGVAFSGIVSGLLLMAVGAAVDVYMGIDATVQRMGRRLDGIDSTDEVVRAVLGR